MRHNKRYWLLLVGLIGLLLSPFVACGQTGYIPYNNDEFGYTVSYPYTWTVEASADGTKCLITSPSRTGSVMIDVTEGLTAKEAANRWLISIGTAWGAIVKLEDKPMEGAWDWYLAYDYEADYGTFHGEAYFKQAGNYVYKLDSAAEKDGYESYPFSTIISSFKLR